MFTISPITAEQVAGMEAKLQGAGTAVTTPNPAKPNEYAIYNQEHKIQGTAVFDPATESLAVTITRKPLLVPERMIKNGIEEALKS